jgi:uncharacterized protein (DUF362 family)
MRYSSEKRVAITRGDRGRLVEDALNLICVPNELKPTTRVLIKPNFVRVPSSSPYAKVKGAYEPTITSEGDVNHREMIEALLRYLTDLGVRDITIGEASGGAETPVIYRALALYELAEEYNANLIDLNYAEAVKVPVKGMVLDHIWVPKVILDSEYTINLAVLKTHGSTVVTLCLKNWGIGIPPGRYYGSNKAGSRRIGADGTLPIHNQAPREQIMGQEVAVSKVLVDVCFAKPPTLNIVDGYTVVDYEKLGGRDYRIRDSNLVVAGHDIVAVDAVGARIMAIDPERVIHIKYAQEMGLGTLDPNEIRVVGAGVDDVRMPCNPLQRQVETMLPRQ